MKNSHKIFTIILTLIILLALPAAVLAQTNPPGGQTYEGNQAVLGNNYVLRTGDTLNGDLVVLGGNAVIESDATVNGDIAILGGNLNISGLVSGTVAALGGNIALEEGAEIRGDIQTLGGNISGLELATVTGSVNRFSPRAFMFDMDSLDVQPDVSVSPVRVFGRVMNEVLSNVLQILAVAVLALVVALLLPKPLNRVAETISSQPLVSGGTGLLTMLVAPLVILIMTITIILIPVALLGVLGAGLALLFGWIAVGFEVGRRMAILFKTEWADGVSAGLGTLVLGVVAWLLSYIFCLGGLAWILIASMGLGGVFLSRIGTRIYTPAAAPVPASRPATPVVSVSSTRPEGSTTPDTSDDKPSPEI